MMLGGLLRWQGYVSSIMRERGHQSVLLLPMSIVGLTIWTHCLYRSEKMEYWQLHMVQTKRYPFLVQSFDISAWRLYRWCVCRCSYTHIYVINIWTILCFKRRKKNTLKITKGSSQNWHHEKPALLCAMEGIVGQLHRTHLRLSLKMHVHGPTDLLSQKSLESSHRNWETPQKCWMLIKV